VRITPADGALPYPDIWTFEEDIFRSQHGKSKESNKK
jgi:hypothetical protein